MKIGSIGCFRFLLFKGKKEESLYFNGKEGDQSKKMKITEFKVNWLLVQQKCPRWNDIERISSLNSTS